MATKSQRKWLKNLNYLLFLTVFLIVAAEIILRIMGFQPWSPPERKSTTSTGKAFFVEKTAYGFTPQPGNFTVNLNDELSFEVHNNAEGYRETRLEAVPDTLDLPEVWIFGGSFTYGWGVETRESFPYLIQDSLADFRVKNFGVPAWGPHQSLHLLRALIPKKRLPQTVIFCYASFHNQRVTCNDFWLKALAGQSATQMMAYPYVRKEQFDYKWGSRRLDYRPIFLQKESALMHFIEIQGNKMQDSHLESYEVTRYVLREMEEQCRVNGINFKLIGLENDDWTRVMVGEFKENGCMAPVNRAQEGMSLEPMDPHPSAAAHRIYAQKILKCLDLRQ